MVGLDGVEPSTSRLSGVRSNRTELQAHCRIALNPQTIRAYRFFIRERLLDLSKLNSGKCPVMTFFGNRSLERR
jgi:hypothetical protein